MYVRVNTTTTQVCLIHLIYSARRMQYRLFRGRKYQSAVGHIRCLCESVGVIVS